MCSPIMGPKLLRPLNKGFCDGDHIHRLPAATQLGGASTVRTVSVQTADPPLSSVESFSFAL